tara:strand:- start:176 stop:664 length:489 start_codon:yes stop_codon:yes gene_type:complete
MAYKMKGFKPFTKGTPYKATDETLVQGARDSVNKDALKATAAAKSMSDTSKTIKSSMTKKNSYKDLEADLDDRNLKKKRELNYKPQSAMKKKSDLKRGDYTTAGTPEVYYNEKGKKINSEFVDEGQLSKVKKDHNGRRFVVEDDTNRKLYLSKEYAPQTQRK